MWLQVPGMSIQEAIFFFLSFFFFFFRFYLFIFREREREGEGEGKKHRCVRDTSISGTPPTGDMARTPGLCPDWEWTR